MNANVTPQQINRKDFSDTRDSDFWTRRREWWRAEAKRQGCDWPGIARTILAVDDYLAGLRKRRAP